MGNTSTSRSMTLRRELEEALNIHWAVFGPENFRVNSEKVNWIPREVKKEIVNKLEGVIRRWNHSTT